MVVKETKRGNTIIRVHDDYIVKTPEEVQEILRRIGRIVARWDIRPNDAQSPDNPADGR